MVEARDDPPAGAAIAGRASDSHRRARRRLRSRHRRDGGAARRRRRHPRAGARAGAARAAATWSSTGASGAVDSARFVVVERARSSRLRVADRRGLAVAARARCTCSTTAARPRSPSRGGMPSREQRAWRSRSRAAIAAWTRHAGRSRMARPDAGDVLRAMDRFHPIPDARRVRSGPGPNGCTSTASSRRDAALLSDVHGRPREPPGTRPLASASSSTRRRRRRTIRRRRRSTSATARARARSRRSAAIACGWTDCDYRIHLDLRDRE